VLDRDLPVVHGDQVCRTLAGGGPRILMLTAAGGVDDRVDGLELGADDYLPKPFALAELVARVRALSRRAPSVPPVLRRGDLSVDLARHRHIPLGNPYNDRYVPLHPELVQLLAVWTAANLEHIRRHSGWSPTTAVPWTGT
jgi:DNA-binding response OmpR family regulator